MNIRLWMQKEGLRMGQRKKREKRETEKKER
jgi:hypothetical protein